MASTPGQAPAWHALSASDVLGRVESDAAVGLDEREAQQRLQRVGPNVLPEAKRRSALAVFIGQFKSPLIYLLLCAAAVALALGERTDASVIVVVVVLNAMIGAIQEGRAERAVAALARLSQHKARIVRGGRELEIEARDVVPGDVLILEAGGAVAADARLLEHAALQVAEAALTGESVPVSKQVEPLAPDAPLADRSDMVYSGTYVAAGRAKAVVVATAMETEIGGIAAMAGTAEAPKTPLERRVEQFGRYVIVAAAFVFVAIVGVGALRGLPFVDLLMLAVSVLVGMVPEGLPVAMTIALAVGVQRMARRKAIVRRLSAVETLGSTTIICSDKTGTLTRNEMTVTAVHLPDGTGISLWGLLMPEQGGDGLTTARAVATRLGIDDVHGEVKPAGKLVLVERLQKEGSVVAMAGDGINDAPALAKADVGIAMGTGTDVAMSSAQVTLVKGDLRGIASARAISEATVVNMKQNLAFAFVYNALGVPLAAGLLHPVTGWLLSPMFAALAMSLSSASVVGNALRLRGRSVP